MALSISGKNHEQFENSMVNKPSKDGSGATVQKSGGPADIPTDTDRRLRGLGVTVKAAPEKTGASKRSPSKSPIVSGQSLEDEKATYAQKFQRNLMSYRIKTGQLAREKNTQSATVSKLQIYWKKEAKVIEGAYSSICGFSSPKDAKAAKSAKAAKAEKEFRYEYNEDAKNLIENIKKYKKDRLNYIRHGSEELEDYFDLLLKEPVKMTEQSPVVELIRCIFESKFEEFELDSFRRLYYIAGIDREYPKEVQENFRSGVKLKIGSGIGNKWEIYGGYVLEPDRFVTTPSELMKIAEKRLEVYHEVLKFCDFIGRNESIKLPELGHSSEPVVLTEPENLIPKGTEFMRRIENHAEKFNRDSKVHEGTQ